MVRPSRNKKLCGKGEAVDPQLTLRLVMLAFWLFMVFRFLKPCVLALKSKSWPTATATVVTSTFDRAGTVYSPKVIYKFTHNGREYQNDNITYLGVASTSKQKAITAAQRYPERGNVTVHFDPFNPQNAVITPGVELKHYASFVLITLFCVAVVYIVQILNFIWPGCQPNCT
jgi:hypothetical protein